MLTEEEKDKIRSEEILRHEIRAQLIKDTDKEKGLKIWGVVNSPFFLWFLSSILIGCISFLYARGEKQKEDARRIFEQGQIDKRERDRTEKKLDAEIASRLNYFGIMYESDNFKALMAVDNPSVANYPINVFPEYANRSLQSLLWELLQVVSDDSKGDVAKAYEASKKFTGYYTSNPGGNSKAGSNKAVEGILKSYAEADLAPLNLERWGSPLEDTVGDNFIFGYKRWSP